MRSLTWVGWLMVALGTAMLAGSVDAGQALFGLLMLAVLAGSGGCMILLASGWDKPLAGSAELHRYGRPSTATVRKVEDATLDSGGTRSAALSLRVTPRNESAFRTRRRVVLPGGRVPAEGERVTIKFDPNRRREFVLLEQAGEATDSVQGSLANLGAP
jgi:hypothetical protein